VAGDRRVAGRAAVATRPGYTADIPGLEIVAVDHSHRE
jgi:hypothetical protein